MIVTGNSFFKYLNLTLQVLIKLQVITQPLLCLSLVKLVLSPISTRFTMSPILMLTLRGPRSSTTTTSPTTH